MPPRLDAAREPFDHPHAGFCRRLAGNTKGAASGLVHRHAFGSELAPTENAVDQFPGVGVFFEARDAARLMVEKDHFSALQDRFGIAEGTALRRDGAAVHAEPEAVGTSGGFGGAIVEIPDLEPARVVPLDPQAVCGAVPVHGGW